MSFTKKNVDRIKTNSYLQKKENNPQHTELLNNRIS